MDCVYVVSRVLMGAIFRRLENAKISGQRSVSHPIQPRDLSAYILLNVPEALLSSGIPHVTGVNKQVLIIVNQDIRTVKAMGDA